MPIYIPDSFDSVGDAVVIGGTGGAGRTTFVSLNDTPSSYSGEAGQIVAVNSGETGLEFIAPPSGTSTFTGLNDTPSSYSGEAGQIVAVNSGETGLEFINAPAGTFLGLTDVTATTYTGLAGAVATVDSSETGIELVLGAETGQTLVKTATGSAFAFVSGQIVSKVVYAPAIPFTGRVLTTSFRVEINAPLIFKAPSTSIDIEGQVYLDAAPGEVINIALSDDPATFNDVGVTITQVLYNGAGGTHDVFATIPFSWRITGLTAGNSYTWYLSLRSSGSSGSRYMVGLTAPPIILKAMAV